MDSPSDLSYGAFWLINGTNMKFFLLFWVRRINKESTTRSPNISLSLLFERLRGEISLLISRRQKRGSEPSKSIFGLAIISSFGKERNPFIVQIAGFWIRSSVQALITKELQSTLNCTSLHSTLVSWKRIEGAWSFRPMGSGSWWSCFVDQWTIFTFPRVESKEGFDSFVR